MTPIMEQASKRATGLDCISLKLLHLSWQCSKQSEIWGERPPMSLFARLAKRAGFCRAERKFDGVS
jgi:hypothetical protein